MTISAEPIGDHNLLKKSPEHSAQTIGDARGIKIVRLVELVEQILRSLDWSGDQLRIEHHVECVNSKMPLGTLVAAVDLDGVAHRLECVKRQADGEDDLNHLCGVMQIEQVGDCGKVGGGEGAVLEDREHADVGDQAADQPGSAVRDRR